MKNKVKLIVNPFIRIAGGQALIWGFLGLIVSTLLCWISGYHYHGLLHFGPAPNPAWWCYLAEHLIVWLIPALLFYLGGLFLSHSRIRVIDVLGTVLFAQLPLLGMNLISLLPAMDGRHRPCGHHGHDPRPADGLNRAASYFSRIFSNTLTALLQLGAA